ncbi:MAG: glycosyltransferase [Victivallaceae bacterium]|nr:glycosyltransferase [Victivallaceae bacterium]
MNAAKEKLSIAIPTYNRAGLLKELLESIRRQFAAGSKLKESVKIYVFDNNSTDNTENTARNAGLEIDYRKNVVNIGGDTNIHQAYTAPCGEYVWVIGDDELIPPGGIEYVLSRIEKYAPALIINRSAADHPLIDVPEFFADYAEFARFAQSANPYLLLGHSLISAMIVRKEFFNAALARDKIATSCYGHLYGIITGIIDKNVPVIYCRETTLKIRNIRAPLYAHDPRKTIPMENLPRYVREQQVCYLEWLKATLQLTELTPATVCLDYYRRVVLHGLLHSPVKTVLLVINRLSFFIYSAIIRRKKLKASSREIENPSD